VATGAKSSDFGSNDDDVQEESDEVQFHETDDESLDDSSGSSRSSDNNGYNNNKNRHSQEYRDFLLALSLQEQFNASLQRRANETDVDDLTTSTGKALAFTKRMISNHDSLVARYLSQLHVSESQNEHPALQFCLVNMDDMVFLAERVFRLQEQYRQEGKDTFVDIGYHYTHSANMDCIRTDGLMSNAERRANSVQNFNGSNGAVLGDGIYTAGNPFSYHSFGQADQGLLVARLKGNTEIIQNEQNRVQISSSNVDSIVGRAGGSDEVCVLRSGSQCLALVQYPASLVDIHHDDALGNKLVYDYHCSAQTIVDQFFNIGCEPTQIQTILASQATVRALLSPQAALQKTISMYSRTMQEMILYAAPDKVKEDLRVPNQEAIVRDLRVAAPPAADCSFCRRSLRTGGAVGRLPRCFCHLHIHCILSILHSHSRKCCHCGKAIGSLQETLPRDTLWVDSRTGPVAVVVKYQTLGNRLNGSDLDRYIQDNSTLIVSYVSDESNSRVTPTKPTKFTFACGMTYEMSFTQKNPVTNKEGLLHWEEIFDNAKILQQLQHHVFKHTKKCVSCRRKNLGWLPIGTMPTGTMRIDVLDHLTCTGYEPGTIVLSYKFNEGVQKSFHVSPGQSVFPTHRIAFLPNNNEGRSLSRRLISAFSRGLTFSVGTSLTTGRPNSITWAIPHKTSLLPSQFGYPDPSFFATANDELDVLGVPKDGNCD
jgi:deltex-like protein